MKRTLALVMVVVLLVGCKQNNSELDRGMAIREKILQANGCEFEAIITADYVDALYEFTLSCCVDQNGAFTFEVIEPESISGITGTISAEGGMLTFDDKVLAFDVLADGFISPVCAPWIVIRTLRSGYLRACGSDGEGIKLEIDDSYAEDALHLDIWTNRDDLPKYCEILWQGRRYLSIEIEKFKYL